MTLVLTPLDGRITLKGRIGEGGMGEVYRAWDAALERPVAVKFLRSGDAKEADRLLLEARLQARVEHPCVVGVHDTGTLGGRPCIVLQLVEGCTLADFGTGSDWRVKVTLAAQAARGLAAAHHLGLVHRDVKPTNILVEETETGPQARLSDFGLARDEEGGLTRSGLLMGTMDFMAPEQVMGSAPVDFRADIYGLGATLYSVLAGRPPFREVMGRTDTLGRFEDWATGSTEEPHPGELLKRLLEEEPRALSLEVPGLPRDLAIVVAKAMEKEPALRYGTAETFAEDLDHVLRGEPVQAKATGFGERAIKWSRRNRTAARVISVAGTLALIGIAYTLYASRRAGQNALENARMGAEAGAMENILRREYLLPSHDLRPVLRSIRQKMAFMSEEKTHSEGPRAYVTGRGHQLLEEWTEARISLERARSLGFKTPEGELAYGLVLAELYQQGIRQVRTIPDKQIQKARMESLKTELMLPAAAAIRTQASLLPERTHTLLGQVAQLEGRLEEALQHARAAQASPAEQAEGLLLEGKVLIEKREINYLKHDHKGALSTLQEANRVLAAARQIARSDPRVVECLVQSSLLMASHQRSLGISTADALAQARTWLDEAKSLHGDDAQLAILEATLLQRQGLSKKDVGQSGVAEDVAALDLLKGAMARNPAKTELLRFLANAYYSYCYAKVAAGQDPAGAFEEGHAVIEAVLKLTPQDWRIPYTGALLAYPQCLRLNNGGLDARTAALRGIQYADQAIALGGATSALGTRGDLLMELAKAQYALGEDPQGTIRRIMADSAQAIAQAPTDQIMRINATASMLLSAQLIWSLQGDIQPCLEKGLQWSEGCNPEYLEAQRNRLGMRLLQLRVAPRESLFAGCEAILQDCAQVERKFHGTLPEIAGTAYRLKAKAQVEAGKDASAAFRQARDRFLQLEQEDPANVQSCAGSAFTCLAEARWRSSCGQTAKEPIQGAKDAVARWRKIQADQPLSLALESVILHLEAEAAAPELKPELQQRAKSRWAQALGRNRNLGMNPEFSFVQAGMP